MANSPRPGVWILERSKDHGKTFTPWQFFADTEADCQSIFGTSTKLIVRDDTVICETRFSKILPLEDGEIAVSLLNGRPSAENFTQSPVLQEFTKATTVRLRLLRPKTTLGHLTSINRQDPTITRRYFYSIKDINIGGLCVCNGHASTCDITNASEPQKLNCKCQHNTCGSQCEYCCDGYVQKKWAPATFDNPFICEPCNCNGHSDKCYYDSEVDADGRSMDINGKYQGGGVCTDCQHNTTGINCHECLDMFYRPFGRELNATNVCEPCQCDPRIHNGSCAPGTGKCYCRPEFQEPDCNPCAYGFTGFPVCKPCQCFRNGTEDELCQPNNLRDPCPCKPEYSGRSCNACSEGHYGFPNCKKCSCDGRGALSDKCNVASGQCDCSNGFGGRTCDQCEVGYYGYPSCRYCDCDRTGTTDQVCNENTGQCICKPGYAGRRCDQCDARYFGFPNCTECACNPTGSISLDCSSTGKCRCQPAFGGPKCSDCSVGHFKYPECIPCNCNQDGSHGTSCDNEGNCICKKEFDGAKCSKCKEGYYNYPRCEACNCDPAGVAESFRGCDTVASGELCRCKERVTGRTCNVCKDLYWNLNINNPNGCEDCRCNRIGTVSNVGNCESASGQCVCKANVYGRGCDTCKDTTFALAEGNLFGCASCHCDIGGSHRNDIHFAPACDKNTGKCDCKQKIDGLRCERPVKTYYYPTLYQYQYEIEDAKTVSEAPARFGYDESIFPNYSWRGYANFTKIMRQVNWNLTVFKPSFYRLIFRYVNFNTEQVPGVVTFVPELTHEETQTANIVFPPATSPRTDFVSTRINQIIQVLLNPGRWIASIKVEKDILIDYMVLIPEAYYEATLLKQFNPLPCLDEDRDDVTLCSHYAYPPLPAGETVSINKPPTGSTNGGLQSKKFRDRNMAVVNTKDTRSLSVNLNVPKEDVYALVIQYHNPLDPIMPKNEPAKLGAKVDSTAQATNTAEGILAPPTEVSLSDCPYDFICRHVITKATDGEVIDYRLAPGSSIAFEVHDMSEDKTLLIDSVVAIPMANWTVDIVTPKLVCVFKNGKCVQANYPPQSEGSKVEFEKDQNPERITSSPFGSSVPFGLDLGTSATSRPSYVWLNESGAPLDGSTDSAYSTEVTGKVPQQGRYRIILHYVQPDHPAFDGSVYIKTDPGSPPQTAVASFEHCPFHSGCRLILHQRESRASNIYYIPENFTIQVMIPNGKSLLLDYTLAIPVDNFDQASLMNTLPYDQSLDFIRKCGKDAFEITNSSSEFCKKNVFSLSVDFNQGAVPCKCDVRGSKSHECEPFGGQCPCKANVIGRTCTQCKPGYWGFPDCKPCTCPSTAFCHPVTGKCVCPTRVTGEKCDHCMLHTYGFDPLLGCEECQCNPQGVRRLPSGRADLQCNVTSGECPCKETIYGRRCDRCLAGYAQFPECRICDCDIRGVTEDICNQDNSNCFCKSNVRGDNCDSCSADSFNLEESNPDGCTKCFCFGTTDRCRPSQLIKSTLGHATSKSWAVVTVGFQGTALEYRARPDLLTDVQEGDTGVTLTMANADTIWKEPPVSPDGQGGPSAQDITNVYFSIPKEYLGKRITSYGGFLNYSVTNNVPRSQGATRSPLSFDVILIGSNITIAYEQDEQPSDANEPFSYSITMTERSFKHLSRSPVTREQMMVVLVNLQGIYIRASYFKTASTIFLSNVTLDTAIEDEVMSGLVTSDFATRVEQCLCPKSYKGSSCEECADGYYRAKTGPYLGFCFPCQCNGHSNECDVQTGKCFNCSHNTHGDHCEFCDPGYYGDATKGDPFSCMICPCPRPDASNNFATACEITQEGEVKCKCKPGYVEPRCDYCSAGYYGTPYETGDYCKPCECNNNIDPTVVGSCDSVSGECLKCLNNSFGPACEICKPGFYGDAIKDKNCQKCNCDECGMDYCDHSSGACVCKPNVVGEQCDQCRKDYFGLNSCKGCQPCNCANASLTTACDPESGQCTCAPGVYGRTCDQCEPGYWKYGPDGCTSCNCEAKYSHGAVCDQETGQCQCLPGVIGEKCDSCPWRWVFIDKFGCRQCDECTHFLLDDTDILKNQINSTMSELTAASVSFLKFRRVSNLDSKVTEFSNQLDSLTRGPRSVTLDPIAISVQSLELNTSIIDHDSSHKKKQALKLLEEASNHLNQSFRLTDNFKLVVNESIKLISRLRVLEDSLSSPVIIENIESKVREAEAIMEILKNYTFQLESLEVQDELVQADKLLNRTQEFSVPSSTLNSKLTEVLQLHQRALEVFNILLNHSSNARSDAVKSDQFNLLSIRMQEQINDLTLRAAKLMGEVNQTNINARAKIEACGNIQTQYSSQIHDIALNTDRLKEKNEKLNRSLKEVKALDIEKLKPMVQVAYSHSLEQHTLAKELKQIFEKAKSSTQTTQAMNAANAYTSIHESLGNASFIANAAVTNVREINSDQVRMETVKGSLTQSKSLLDEAKNMSSSVETNLNIALTETSDFVGFVSGRMDDMLRELNKVTSDLGVISTQNFQPKIKSSIDSADEVIIKSNETITKVLELLQSVNESDKQAHSIPETYRNVTNDIKLGENFIEKITTTIPDAAKLIKKGEVQEPTLSKLNQMINERLAELKKLIAQARGDANRIELGVNITSDASSQSTSIQLRNPDNLITSGLFTKFQMSFRTRETNGLLAYIGTPILVNPTRKRRRDPMERELWLNDAGDEDDPEMNNLDDIEETESPTETEDAVSPASTSVDGTSNEVTAPSGPSEGSDFMALDLVNGKVRATFDLGSGPESATNSLNVSNDAWHDVLVERNGKSVRLFVVANDSRQETTAFRLVGSHNVFNLNPLRSAIYVAGIPAGVSIQKDINNTQLTSGFVSNVFFGDAPLGLWNFAEGSNMVTAGVEPKAVAFGPTSDTTSNGMRFDGNSYVILLRDTRFDFKTELYLQFRFKTFAREGLMFLVGNDAKSEYLAVYLSESRIHLSFDLGSGYVIISSRENVGLNDGDWHLVKLSRNAKQGLLQVDDYENEIKETIGIQTTLETNEKIYVGGFPGGNHGYGIVIPKVNFEGCIQDVQIDNYQFDLSNNIEASAKVIKGCPDAVSREASMVNTDTSLGAYLSMPLRSSTNLSSLLTLNIKYRSPDPSGLLFYVSNELHTSFLALYLSEGRIVLRCEPGNYHVQTRNAYYGDGWHYVTAIKDRTKLQIEVDDNFDDLAKIPSPEPLEIEDAFVYFGGVPKGDSYILVNKNMPFRFTGCFGDVTLNDAFQNFATSPNRPGVSLASCPLGEVLPPKSLGPPDPKPAPATTTVPPVTTTEAPIIRKGCALRTNPPSNEPGVSVAVEGLRFGNVYDSRQEFMITPTMVNNLMDESSFELEFRTSAMEGVLLYLGSNQVVDYVALYLNDGKIHAAWNTGSGNATIVYEDARLNDSAWHHVSFNRKGKTGWLSVDGSDRSLNKATSPGEANALNVKPPLYIGGVPLESAKQVKNNLKGIANSFPGCVRNFTLQNHPQDFFKDSISYGSAPCDSFVEPGMFIYDGHIILRDKFRVGDKITINMKVKPRSLNGVLLYVAGKSDFLALTLINGTVKFAVDNGGGQFSTTSKPVAGTICDGEWYAISAVKQTNIITVSINGKALGVAFGVGGIASTDTSGPLYLGGVPKNEPVVGIEGVNEHFVGCIADLEISNQKIPFHTLSNYAGDIRLNTCHTN